MKRARRPPLHPNCRSTLIPVVDLIDPETGEKIEETAERPAQNADGTYSQVAAKTTFKDYFESQPETFQREWLGEKRFELWKSGQLKFEDLAKPATTYRATTADLTSPTEKPKETAASDDKSDKAPATPPANEPLAPWEGPDELARLREKKRVDPATLPTLDGSPKQVAWVRDRIRADQVDAFNAVDLPEYLKTRIGGATDDEEEARRLALVRTEIEKRGETAVLAELEEAAQEIAAKKFAETSCRVWIDGRFGPGVLHRSTTEALRRVATTGSAKPPKPAFDLPPLDLPELVLTRLEGTPRQQSWAEDLRRRAVRDLTIERANETARDALRRYRDKESAFAEEFRSDLEAAIKAVGGDEAAELILGREIFLDARGYVESFDRARDWINLHVADKKTLLEAAEFHVAGNPQNVAAILRRYAADAKAQAPQSDAPRKTFSPPSAVQDRVDSERDKRIEKFFAANGWTFAPPSKETVDLLRAKIPAKFQPSDAQALMPEKEIRQAVEEGLDFIARIVENSGHSADVLADVKISPVLSDGRGEYSNGVSTLNGFDFGGVRASVVHELGHALENLLPGVKTKAVEHYREVADVFAAPEPLFISPKEAEELRKAGKPFPVYIPPEKESYFPDPYVARYYESNDPQKRDAREPRDTEFVSSCLEYLINGATTCETNAEFTADVLRLLKKETVKR